MRILLRHKISLDLYQKFNLRFFL